MTSIPAVPLTPAAAADHLRRPLLVMAHPRHRQDSCGNGNDAEGVSSSRNPEYNAGQLNGKGVLTFDEDYLPCGVKEAAQEVFYRLISDYAQYKNKPEGTMLNYTIAEA